MSRSIAEQSVADLGGPTSVLVRQRRDHYHLEQLLQQVSASAGADRQDALTDLCRLVFPHAFAEEAVLWPLLRRTVADGATLTLRVEQEHQQINELFTRLEQVDPEPSEHATLFAQITDLLRQDVRDEEDVLLPRLQQTLGVDALRRAGRVWEIVRRTAPTRPHPVVSRRPPGNAVAALPLTGIDRARDRCDRVARHAPRYLAGPARRTSHVLATIAGTVEHLPSLRRGEHPSTHC
ncbi:hemerythrin domain-containing protein [Rhodococcus opacus]|uniref:Cation-binding protein n=1 Tax=Rhodococcus opacus TaxID=37919 RepID=A0A2S8IRA7_RHOOP|nr:hemerythrin domain-containing protein [Rhodococcus opacus]PQP17298.1 cation-binding protein [Rhodococcus opacus]